MKKAIKIVLFTLMLTLVFGGVSLAAYNTGSLTLGSSDTMTFQTSNNVYVDYTAGTNGISYVAGAYHNSGTRTFGTSSGDTRIYYQEKTAATLPSAPSSNTGTAVWTGWKAL